MGKLRSATGISRLRIVGPDEATGRGTALAAGQYITDDIYVELVTDARGFTATQLEVSLTPWLSLLSQAGGLGRDELQLARAEELLMRGLAPAAALLLLGGCEKSFDDRYAEAQAKMSEQAASIDKDLAARESEAALAPQVEATGAASGTAAGAPANP